MNTSLAKKKSSQIKMKYKNWAMWKLTKEKKSLSLDNIQLYRLALLTINKERKKTLHGIP